jgi:serine/threonine protein kinase
MPRLSDLANLLIGCRIVSRERWDRAERSAHGDLPRILVELAAERPAWWDGSEPAPPGLTEYQQTMIEVRYLAGELAELRHDLALNQFLLLDQLGVGGQGAVYRSRQFNPPRFVAVKTLIRDTEIGRRRFEQEARTMMKIGHPAISRFFLYERVRDSFGKPTDEYLIAMEFVDGTNLARLVRRIGPVPWPFAARWAIELLGGLDVIHWNGFVHRDVKPENVMMIGPDPGPDTDPGDTAVKLLDFGAVASTTSVSTDGSGPRFAGTREYAPPEQWCGEALPASDLYGLGGTLFYALTGRPPYRKPNRDALALRKAHMEEPIPDAHEHNPAVPEEFSRALQRMMAKEPGNRGTAAELVDEFSRLLRGTRAEVAKPTAAPTKSKPAKAAASRLKPPVEAEARPATSIAGSILGVFERIYIPSHLRPLPGQEPALGERIAALLRRPLLLVTLAVLLGVVILALR